MSNEDMNAVTEDDVTFGTKDSRYVIDVHDIPGRDGYWATEPSGGTFVRGSTPQLAARNLVLEVTCLEPGDSETVAADGGQADD